VFVCGEGNNLKNMKEIYIYSIFLFKLIDNFVLCLSKTNLY